MTDTSNTKIEGIMPDFRGDEDDKKKLLAEERNFKAGRPLEIPGPKFKARERGIEKGKVHELNAEFLNQRLTNYVEQAQQQEIERVEKKYGKGWWGKAKRWMEETDLGKALKVGTKVIGGGIAAGAVLLGSGGLAAPLLLSLGGRAFVDGVLEGIQYAKERSTIRELEKLREDRLIASIELAKVRNEIQQKLSASGDEIWSLETASSTGEIYRTRLENLIKKTANTEEEILKQEKGLNLSQKRWKIGRFIAGLATMAGTIAYTGIYGIKTGIRDADRLAALAKGAHQGLVPYPPGAAVKDAMAFLTPSHETRLFFDGWHFVYDKADVIMKSAAGHLDPTKMHVIGNLATGLKTHLMGNMPWQLYASSIGAVLGLAGATAKEISDMVKLGKISKEDLKAAIFSLRSSAPRSTIVGHEKELTAPPPIYYEFYQGLKEGHVWRVRVDGNFLTPNPSKPETLYKIKKIDDRAEDIYLIKIDEKTGKEIDGSEETIRVDSFYNLQNINPGIYKKDSVSFETLDAQKKQENKVKWEKWLKDNEEIAAGLGLWLTAANVLKDKDGNDLHSINVEWAIFSIDAEHGTAVLMSQRKQLNPVTNSEMVIKERKTINLDDLKNAKEGPNSSHVIIGETKEKTAEEKTKETPWAKLQKKFKDAGKDIDDAFIKSSIFKFNGNYYVVIHVDSTNVNIRKVVNRKTVDTDDALETRPIDVFVAGAETTGEIIK